VNPNLIFWEIVYDDGQVLSEEQGIKYGEAPRAGVHSIRLVSVQHHQVLAALNVEGSRNFFYRRRTRMTQGGQPQVVFLLGVYPDFEVEFNPATGKLAQVPVDIDPLSVEIS
jgi:hypothetical protein